MSNTKSKSEKWVQIIMDGKEWPYEISSKGRVRHLKKGNIITPDLSNSGYQRVRLYDKSDKKKYSVHRLVAIHFIPIPKKYLKLGLGFDDLVPDHKDCIKTHNVKSNLQWKTPKENTIIAYEKGLLDGYVGENSHLAKMTNETAIKCCKLLAKGEKTGDIAKKLNVSKKSVQHIKNRETWTHLSKDFVFPKLIKSKPFTINEKDIHKICKMISEKKYSDSEIARKFGVTREYVRDVRLRKLRKDISKDYIFE